MAGSASSASSSRIRAALVRAVSDAGAGTVSPLLGPGLQPVIGLQAKNLAQDFLASAGSLVGEFVRPALHQKRRIYEGVVVHPDDEIDLLLGLARRVTGDGPGFASVEDPQLEVGAASPAAAARHPVGLPPGGEVQLDPALVGAVGDQVVQSLTAGCSPQRPSDCVKQRRLAVPVGAAKAGHANTGKVEGGNVLPVGTENCGGKV